MSCLQVSDDFMNLDQIKAATGASSKQAMVSLWYLKNTASAIDSVESGGVLYWFASALTDKRGRIQEQRIPEDKPRATRKRKAIANEVHSDQSY